MTEKTEAAALEPDALKGAKRILRVKKARDSLLDFTHLTMPHPSDPSDPDLSLYQEATHHRLIAEALEKVEQGEILRLIITMPPRSGKSELCSRRLPAWAVGRNPHWHVIFATYAADFAQDFGREVRDIMRSPAFRLIFPTTKLKRDSQASDFLKTEANGQLVFVGVGGPVTGRGADLFIIDDPFKSRQEAESQATRRHIWSWFTSTAFTRLMPGGRIVIIMTRWHEDDLVGRIFDPEFVDPAEAETWTMLELPALKDGKALWPERYPVKVLESIRRTIGPRDWSALYQQRPTPEDGDYFKREWIEKHAYGPKDLPGNLRIYGASDHALTTKEENDATCLGCFGIDEDDHIWILPDVVWDRMETDGTVEAMIDQMRRHRPQIWWAEDEHIKKAIGPFLRKRQQEERIYTYVESSPATKDHRTRARSIQGRMSMGMVHLPRFAPWYADALDELLKFPNAKHDDFVSFLAHIGMGLDTIRSARTPSHKPSNVIRVGSLAWVKAQSNLEQRERKRAQAIGGM